MNVKLELVSASWMCGGNDIRARLARCHNAEDVPLTAPPSDAAVVPQSQLLAALVHHQEIGAFVAGVLQRDGLLTAFLRHNRGTVHAPSSIEAIALLAAAIVQAGEFDPERGVPTQFFSVMGAEGWTLSQMLRAALTSSPPPLSSFMREHFQDLAASQLGWSAQEATLDALMPTRVRRPLEHSPFARPHTPPSSLSVPIVPRAMLPLPTAPVTLLTLASGLSYTAEHVFDAARLAMKAARHNVHPQLGWRSSSPAADGFGAALLAAVAQSRRHLISDAATVAAAVLLVAAEFKRDDGSIDMQAWVAQHPAAQMLIADAYKSATSTTPTRTPNAFYGRMIDVLAAHPNRENSRALVDSLVRDTGLIPRAHDVMPALSAVVAVTKDDANTERGLVATMHLFPTIVPLIEAVIAKGMKPQDIHLLGTPYGTDPMTVAYLRMLGCHVQPGVDHGGDTKQYTWDRLCEVHAFAFAVLKHIKAHRRPERGFRVHDDGGILQRVLSGQAPLDAGGVPAAEVAAVFTADNTVATQHTTRGLTEIRKGRLAFQTIMMASAPPKKAEGDVIGHDLADGVELSRAQYGLESKRMGLIGLGAVGTPSARELVRRGVDVMVHDKDEAAELRSGIKATVGSEVAELFAAVPDGVALSVTGKTVISGMDVRGFTGVLVSGSSAAVEFDREQLEIFGPVRIANRGRPINLRGDGTETLTAGAIDMTRALAFVGITQPYDEALGVAEVPLEAARSELALATWRENGGHLPKTRPSAPMPLRPDTLGECSHETWMNFLARRKAPVMPSPCDVAEQRGIYYFVDVDGIRRIDTRQLRSCSVPVALPGPPDLICDGQHANSGGFVSGLMKDDPRGARYLAVVTSDGRVEQLDWCDALSPPCAVPDVYTRTVNQVRIARRDPRGAEPGALIICGSQVAPYTLALQPVPGAEYLLRPDYSIVEVDRASCRVRTGARTLAPVWLPFDLVRIDGITMPSGVPVIVGGASDGTTLLCVAVGDPDLVFHLPPGATIRGLQYLAHWRMRVSYSLAGDAVETENLHFVDIPLAGSSVPGRA